MIFPACGVPTAVHRPSALLLLRPVALLLPQASLSTDTAAENSPQRLKRPSAQSHSFFSELMKELLLLLPTPTLDEPCQCHHRPATTRMAFPIRGLENVTDAAMAWVCCASFPKFPPG